MSESYPSLKKLPKPVHVEGVERTPKGMVRRSVYNRKLFQSAFKKGKSR